MEPGLRVSGGRGRWEQRGFGHALNPRKHFISGVELHEGVGARGGSKGFVIAVRAVQDTEFQVPGDGRTLWVFTNAAPLKLGSADKGILPFEGLYKGSLTIVNP